MTVISGGPRGLGGKKIPSVLIDNPRVIYKGEHRRRIELIINSAPDFFRFFRVIEIDAVGEFLGGSLRKVLDCLRSDKILKVMELNFKRKRVEEIKILLLEKRNSYYLQAESIERSYNGETPAVEIKPIFLFSIL